MGATDHANAVLTIDVGAVVDNWRRLRDLVAPATCAAVVKADAYGLGAHVIAPALAAAGCRVFFVATLDEGLALRCALPKSRIAVLGAAIALAPDLIVDQRLTPVLNSLSDVALWADYCAAARRPHPAMVQLDTGMSRLGLSPEEAAALTANRRMVEAFPIAAILSHLACADDASHPKNAEQLAAFRELCAALPAAPASLANSGGIFLGAPYHLDLVRPGIALYGGSTNADRANSMSQVVQLQGRILQVRQIDSPQTVGYGATYRATRRQRIATVGVGYADGYFRALSNRGWGTIAGWRAPLVGRVSMDLITFDVSEIPESLAAPGEMIDLIGPDYRIDAVAADAGTISYEILTALGPRYRRCYRNAVSALGG